MSSNPKQPLIRRHIALEEVLRLATPDELVAIADILLDKANDRLLGDASSKQRLARRYESGELYKAVNEIAFEIRALGSASLASLLRGGEPVSYDEVVQDVASELGVKFSKADSTSTIEERVLEMLVDKLAEQAEPERQTASGSLFFRAGLNSAFASFLGPLSKFGLGAAGAGMLGGALAASIFMALPLTAIGAVTAGVLAARSRDRPELSGITMIVVHVARIRGGVIAADHEDFATRLRACL